MTTSNLLYNVYILYKKGKVCSGIQPHPPVRRIPSNLPLLSFILTKFAASLSCFRFLSASISKIAQASKQSVSDPRFVDLKIGIVLGCFVPFGTPSSFIILTPMVVFAPMSLKFWTAICKLIFVPSELTGSFSFSLKIGLTLFIFVCVFASQTVSRIFP